MTILDLDQYSLERGLVGREQLIHALRQDFATASQIASLVTTELRSADPELIEYCDKEMAWFFDDLGNCFYDCWTGVKNALMNGSLLATKPTTGDLHGRFLNMPAIVLAAGPGANERWDAIKASRGKAILFVCDVMLEPCLARGIIPDFVCSLERVPASFECMEGMPKDGIIALVPPVIERRVVDDFRGNIIWCWRGCGLEVWIDPRIPRSNFGRSCGVQGIASALIAGCNPIYLVGHDCCMQGDKTHADDAQATTKGTAEHLDTDEYHRRIPAKSMSGKDVTTIHLWGMFKSDIEHLCRAYAWATVVNTGDGLSIESTYPGELPEAWGNPIQIPVITRAKCGQDPSQLIDLMLADMPALRERCLEVMALTDPNYEQLMLSKIVHVKTAWVWAEIFASIYVPALVRLHLDPSQHLKMLKRVAKTILYTLDFLEKELHALKNP